MSGKTVPKMVALGRVEAIFLAPVASAPMVSTRRCRAVVGRGLLGDRYAEGRGSFSDRCQVTLIEAEHLDSIVATQGLRVLAGEHRRNIVTRGVDHALLVGRRFRVGAALLAYHSPRLPCAYLVRLTEPEIGKALGERAGICADVIEGGSIAVGDAFLLAAD
jgi:MOSC domain-containing protein YiiM